MNKHRIQEKLYLLLGLFFITTPIFAEPLTAAAIAGIAAAGVTVLSSIGGAIGAGAQRRRAERRERAARARRMAAEANRQDIPDFQQDLANPYANLQVATQANIMQAEQADISLASSLDTLRATGASAGGATALARAATQSKRGVAASIEQQEARNAQLRAQGEMQAAQMRQRGQHLAFQAQEAREMTQLDREASLESSYNQQAAAYGAQSSAMVGQAVGAAASLGLQGVQGGFDSAARTQWKDLTSAQRSSYQDIGGFKGFKTAYQGLGKGATYDWSKGIDWKHDVFRRNEGLRQFNPNLKPVVPVGGMGQENKIIPVGGNIPRMELLHSKPRLTQQEIEAMAAYQVANLNLGGTSSMYHSDDPYQTYSDRRLKEDIKLIGYSPSGLNIYSFKYIGGNETYQGAMSNEVPKHAVIKDNNGYDKVDYSKLDVKFKLI